MRNGGTTASLRFSRRQFAAVTFATLLAAEPAVAQRFGRPAPLDANATSDTTDDSLARMATDGAGTWIVVWTGKLDAAADADIFFTRSTNGGATWSPVAALNTNAAIDASGDSRPVVATDGSGRWVAAWVGGFGTDADILTAYSTDNGATWTPPAELNTNAGTDTTPDAEPQIATDGTTWVAVWRLFSAGDFDVLTARSTDGGATWSAPAQLNIDTGADTDSLPDVAMHAGTVVAVWNHGDPSTDADILTARSVDSGATWTAPVALNVDAATDSGQDLAPNVETDGASWVTVWHRYPDVLVARSTDGGMTWSAPATLGEGDNPRMAAGGAGHWVVTWEAAETFTGDDLDIHTAGSTDGGATWTPPAPVDRKADRDFVNDSLPDVALDSTGTVVVVWTFNNQGFRPTRLGRDSDLLVARHVQCAAAPATGCRTPTVPFKSPLVLRDGPTQLLTWKWLYGEETMLDAFGDPLGVDDYVLCVYDESGVTPSPLIRADAPAGSTCGGRPCWEAYAAGFTYSDRERPATPDGLRSISLKAGLDGIANITVRGKDVPLPPLPVNLPLRVQLQAGNGQCWEAQYTAAGVDRNDTRQFRGVAGP